MVIQARSLKQVLHKRILQSANIVQSMHAYIRLLKWKVCLNTPVHPRVKIVSVRKRSGSHEVCYRYLESHAKDPFTFTFFMCLFARIFFKRKTAYINVRNGSDIAVGTIMSLSIKSTYENRTEKGSLKELDDYIKEFELIENFISPTEYQRRLEEKKQNLIEPFNEDLFLLKKEKERWSLDTSRSATA